MIGRTLGHYRVLTQLGQGGMGIVYRVHDVQLGRDVAIKTLPVEIAADPERRRRFVQEAQAAGSLSHPNIAAIHEIGDVDGVLFIVMELVDGRKLSDVLLDGPMPLPRAIAVAADIAAGLAGAHNKGVIHRDLNPANVMVTRDGHAKIIDFGLAKLLAPQMQDTSATTVGGVTAPGLIVGTVPYMSPEQARSLPVDARTDIFSLGVTLFEMVTGQTPFRGGSPLDTLHAIMSAAPPPVRIRSSEGAELAPELQRIVHRCLEKEPDHRYQTALDLGSELRRLQRHSDAHEFVSAPRARGGLARLSLAATAFLVTEADTCNALRAFVFRCH